MESTHKKRRYVNPLEGISNELGGFALSQQVWNDDKKRMNAEIASLEHLYARDPAEVIQPVWQKALAAKRNHQPKPNKDLSGSKKRKPAVTLHLPRPSVYTVDSLQQQDGEDENQVYFCQYFEEKFTAKAEKKKGGRRQVPSTWCTQGAYEVGRSKVGLPRYDADELKERLPSLMAAANMSFDVEQNHAVKQFYRKQRKQKRNEIDLQLPVVLINVEEVIFSPKKQIKPN